MANATAAGPSFGVFDMLFGTAPKEEAAPAEEQFGPILKLIKALNEKGDEDTERAAGRTAKETTAGHLGTDVPYANLAGMTMMPTLYPNMNMDDVNQMLSAPPPEQAVMGKSAASSSMLSAQQTALMDALNPLAQQPEAMSPELKALYAGLLMGSAINEVKQQGEQANTQLSAANQVATAAVIGMPKQSGIRQLAYTPSAEDAAMSLSSTQDFLGMRGLAKLDPSRVTQMDKANASTAESSRKSSAETNGEGERVLPESNMSPDQLLGATFAAGTGLRAGMGSNSAMAKDIFLQDASKEGIRGGVIPELAQSISVQNAKGGGEMRMIIHPEHLGEIHLKVGTSKGGKVDVSLLTESKEVADAVRVSSKELELALQGHQLELGRFDVKVADASNQKFVAEAADTSSMNSRSDSDFGFNQGQNAQSDLFSQQEKGFAQQRRDNQSEMRQESEFLSRQTPLSARSGGASANRSMQNGRLDVVA